MSDSMRWLAVAVLGTFLASAALSGCGPAGRAARDERGPGRTVCDELTGRCYRIYGEAP